MSFHVLAGLNKKSTSKHINGASFWSAISNLQNDSFAAKVAGTRLNNTLKKDVAIRSAVTVLKQAVTISPSMVPLRLLWQSSIRITSLLNPLI